VEIRLRGEWGLGVGLELEMGRLAAKFFFNGGLGCSELLSADLLIDKFKLKFLNTFYDGIS
jgi:hypothetical protein